MHSKRNIGWSGRSQNLVDLARKALPRVPINADADTHPLSPVVKPEESVNRIDYVKEWLEGTHSPAKSVTDSEIVIFEDIFAKWETPSEITTAGNNQGGVESKPSTDNLQAPKKFKLVSRNLKSFCSRRLSFGHDKGEISERGTLLKDRPLVAYSSSSADDISSSSHDKEPIFNSTGILNEHEHSNDHIESDGHMSNTGTPNVASNEPQDSHNDAPPVGDAVQDQRTVFNSTGILNEHEHSNDHIESDDHMSNTGTPNVASNEPQDSHNDAPPVRDALQDQRTVFNSTGILNEHEHSNDHIESEDHMSNTGTPNVASNEPQDIHNDAAPVGDAVQDQRTDRPSSPCNAGEEAQRKNVRQRGRDPSRWLSNVRKKLKNSGEAYVSSRFKQFEAKKMRPPCACRFNCVLRLSEEERQKQFDIFWALGNHERQWDYIRQNSTNTAANKRKRTDYKDTKKTARTFSFMVSAKKVRVCKHMFLATLSIWDSWVKSAYSHMNAEKGNTNSPDKRGKHTNHAIKYTQPIIDSVKEHVNTFERVPSHYCRVRTKREYLSTGLSLAKMARLYQEWSLDKGLPKTSIATWRQYTTIVNANFNLGFFKPKKDRCQLCSIITNKLNTRVIREKYKQQFALHVKNKQKARKLKAKDKSEAVKNPSTISVSAFDLQKQLQCPKSDASPFYYRSKLTLHNLTVFNMVTRLGICRLWHEGAAKKGSNEIASCLWYYIKGLVASGIKDVRLYSDNCSGQNKNRFIFAMYVLAAVFFVIKITHRYLEVGHTQMEVDSIHARIEESTKGLELFDYNDWVQAIEKAKEEAPPYEVKHLNKSNVFDFKPLVSQQNWEKSLNGEKLQWRKIREFSIDGSSDQLVRVKYDLDGPTIAMSVNKVGRPVNLKTYVPPPAYTASIPLSANTITDLTWLCDTMAIPITKQQFFRNVIAGCDPTTEDVVSEVEYETDDEIFVGDEVREEVTTSAHENDEEDEA